MSGIFCILCARKSPKNLASRNRRFMYQPKFQQLTFENFHLPFGGKLDPGNR
jgi:hypothetical protein